MPERRGFSDKTDKLPCFWYAQVIKLSLDFFCTLPSRHPGMDCRDLVAMDGIHKLFTN